MLDDKNVFKICWFLLEMENGYIVLADPNGLGWEFAQQVHEEIQRKKNNGNTFQLGKVNIRRFRDGEILPKIEDNVRERRCFFIHDGNKDPAEWFTELCLVNEALQKSSADRIIDVFPYMRFPRQDRKTESRVPISAAVVAHVVDLYSNGVLTLDVHNAAIDGFFKCRFDNLYSFPTAVKYIREHLDIEDRNLTIMSADVGGAKRTEAFAKHMGIRDMAFGYKSRGKDGEIEVYRIAGDVKGRDVLIVDDILESGGTMVKGNNTAREEGARKVYGYCPHGLFTKGTDYVLPHFDRFFVGDTLKQQPRPNLEVIPFAPLFAEAIYRMSTGASLSELFE